LSKKRIFGRKTLYLDGFWFFRGAEFGLKAGFLVLKAGLFFHLSSYHQTSETDMCKTQPINLWAKVYN
jgi:hypothetical protein